MTTSRDYGMQCSEQRYHAMELISLLKHFVGTTATTKRQKRSETPVLFIVKHIRHLVAEVEMVGVYTKIKPKVAFNQGSEPNRNRNRKFIIFFLHESKLKPNSIKFIMPTYKIIIGLVFFLVFNLYIDVFFCSWILQFKTETKNYYFFNVFFYSYCYSREETNLK